MMRLLPSLLLFRVWRWLSLTEVPWGPCWEWWWGYYLHCCCLGCGDGCQLLRYHEVLVGSDDEVTTYIVAVWGVEMVVTYWGTMRSLLGVMMRLLPTLLLFGVWRWLSITEVPWGPCWKWWWCYRIVVTMDMLTLHFPVRSLLASSGFFWLLLASSGFSPKWVLPIAMQMFFPQLSIFNHGCLWI